MGRVDVLKLCGRFQEFRNQLALNVTSDCIRTVDARRYSGFAEFRLAATIRAISHPIVPLKAS